MKKIDANKMKTLEDLKKDLFKKPGFRAAYKELEPEFRIIRALALARMKKGLNQRQLAKKIGITQSALARFESGKVDPRLTFLKKVTAGLGLKLIVK
jgi:ribosome-binding protein aMBF1 (putative translation factor)